MQPHRDTFAQRLVKACPVAWLAREPWAEMPEANRESWRLLADVALKWNAPSGEAIASAIMANTFEPAIMEAYARIASLETENAQLMARLRELEGER
jgi:hypothetical protein